MDETNITLLDCNVPSGSSCVLLGGSMTGKSSLAVTALHNILKYYPERFDLIILFTESMNATPLQHLPSGILIFPMFMPDLVKVLVRINLECNNRYGILIVCDDCRSMMRGNIADNLFTIYRNSGISTIAIIQEATMVKPSMRSNAHNIYFTGARTHEGKKKFVELFVKGHLEDKGYKTMNRMANFVSKATELGEQSRKIIHLNNLEDRMDVYEIKKT